MCSSNTSLHKHYSDLWHRSPTLLMLALLPSIHCAAAFCIAAHHSATVTSTSVLQLPLKLLHHAAYSIATANYCTATQLLRSKKLKDITQQLIDKSVWLHLITETPYVAALHCLSRASALLLFCTAYTLLKSHQPLR